MYPLLKQSKLQNSYVYSRIFQSVRYYVMSIIQKDKRNSINQTKLQSLSNRQMKRISLDQFLDESFQRSRRMREEEEIGLFTFYRQQQEKEEERKIFSKTKKQEHRKLKRRQKKNVQNQANQPLKEKEVEQTFNQSCQSFLKNVNIRSFKDRLEAAKDISLTQGIKDKRPEHTQYIQLQQAQTQSQDVTLDHTHLSVGQDKVVSEVIEPQIRLKRFDDILRPQDVNNDQIQPQSTKPSPRKIGKLTFKIKTEPSYLSHLTPQRVAFRVQIAQIRPLLQHKATIKKKSLQQSFLEKVRTPQYVSKSKIKRLINVNPLDSIHSANQRYISTLLNNFQLPQHSNNQAAKMLRQTFKFPNVLLAREPFKRQSYSPTRFAVRVNNDRNSLSCRKRSDGKMSPMIVEGQESFVIKSIQNSRGGTKHQKLYNRKVRREQLKVAYLTKSLISS